VLISLDQTKADLIKKLKEQDVLAPAFEASILLCHFLGFSKERLLAGGEAKVRTEEMKKLNEAVLKRLSGVPLQYLIGRWEFMGLPFWVNPGVLIPRGDTEVLVEWAVEDIQKREGEVSVLDLCCGSGCIGIAVASFCKNAKVQMWDISQKALSVGEQNIKLNGLDGRVICKRGDALQPEGEERFDYILCNPPYLTKEDMKNLQREVAFEPETALYGGEDGLLFYRTICEQFYPHLHMGGKLYFEIGAGQRDDVAEIMKTNGFCDLVTYKDYGGVERVICGKKH
jgi:release factor glutamine methyltransferase